MNNALKKYISQYVVLETAMQELLPAKCKSLCASCSLVCCDVVMCIEAIKSPFLKLVHQQTDRYHEQNGFLSPTGCTLKKGRPSVCYEYYCDNQFYFQPDDRHAEILLILGSLIHHATRHAQGDTQLEDIASEEALDQLDFDRLNAQLQESQVALEIIRAFYHNGTLSDANLATLKRIHIPAEFDTPTEASARH
jgi:hypothetical protein